MVESVSGNPAKKGQMSRLDTECKNRYTLTCFIESLYLLVNSLIRRNSGGRC